MESADQISSIFSPAFVAALGKLKIRARVLSTSVQSGNRKTRQRGRSMEFMDFRGYVPGDDPRDLDWKALARFDSLLIKQYSAEVALPLVILVDPSPSMDWGAEQTKFIASLRAGAALTRIALATDTPVLWGNFAHRQNSLRRLQEFPRLLRDLDQASASDFLPLKKSMEDFAKSQDARTYIAFTDGYDAEELLPQLRLLRKERTEVTLLLTLHLHELLPPYSGDVGLMDSESGEEVRISVSDLDLQRYKERLNQFRASWAHNCRRLEIEFGELAVGPGQPTVNLASLQKCGLVTGLR